MQLPLLGGMHVASDPTIPITSRLWYWPGFLRPPQGSHPFKQGLSVEVSKPNFFYSCNHESLHGDVTSVISDDFMMLSIAIDNNVI